MPQLVQGQHCDSKMANVLPLFAAFWLLTLAGWFVEGSEKGLRTCAAKWNRGQPCRFAAGAPAASAGALHAVRSAPSICHPVCPPPASLQVVFWCWAPLEPSPTPRKSHRSSLPTVSRRRHALLQDGPPPAAHVANRWCAPCSPDPAMQVWPGPAGPWKCLPSWLLPTLSSSVSAAGTRRLHLPGPFPTLPAMTGPPSPHPPLLPFPGPFRNWRATILFNYAAVTGFLIPLTNE